MTKDSEALGKVVSKSVLSTQQRQIRKTFVQFSHIEIKSIYYFKLYEFEPGVNRAGFYSVKCYLPCIISNFNVQLCFILEGRAV